MSRDYLGAFALGRQQDLATYDSLAGAAFGFPMPAAGPAAGPAPGPVAPNSPAGGIAPPPAAAPATFPKLPGVAGIVFDEFTKAGYPANAAYGVLGNVQQESGFNPLALNKGEGAFGLFQHRLDRRTGLEGHAKGAGVEAGDPAAQARYAIWELENKFPEVAAALKRGDITPEEAATIFDRGFEKSSGAHTQQRQRYARAFAGGEFEAFDGGPNFGGVTVSSRNAPDMGGNLTPEQAAAIKASPLVSPPGGFEEEPDMSFEAQRRSYLSALGVGIFKGIGDIAKGKTADITPFLDAHEARQKEMRQRLKEIREAKATAAGRETLLNTIATENPDLLALASSGEEGLKMAQETMLARTGQAIAQENLLFEDTINDTNRAQEHQLVSDAISGVFGDKEWGEKAAAAAIADPALASTIIDQGYKADAAAAEKAATDEANANLAAWYRQNGSEAAATHAENGDAVGARDIYKQETGDTTDIQNYEYVKQLPADQRADFLMQQGIKAGVIPVEQQAALDVKKNQLNEQGKAFTNNPMVLGKIQAAMELMKSEGFRSGPVTAATLPILNALTEFGWNPVAEGTDAETAFQSMMEGTISYLRQAGEGSMSEGDAERLRKGLPSLSNSEEANAIIAYAQQVVMQRAEAAFNAKLTYFGQNGVRNPDGEKGFVDEELKKFNAAEGFSEDSIFIKGKPNEDYSDLPYGTPVVFESSNGTTRIFVKGISTLKDGSTF